MQCCSKFAADVDLRVALAEVGVLACYRDVWMAEWHGMPVAAKVVDTSGVATAKEPSAAVNREIQLLKYTTSCYSCPSVSLSDSCFKKMLFGDHSTLCHPNIVMFLGACIKKPTLCILLEHCVSLVLQDTRWKVSSCSRVIVSFSMLSIGTR